MIRSIIIFSIVLSSSVYSFDGVDYMLNRDILYSQNGKFNIYDSRNSAIFRNCRLYDISSLEWTYAAAKLELGSQKIIVSYKNYGIEKLYEETEYSALIGSDLISGIDAGIGISREEYRYGDNLYKYGFNNFFAYSSFSLSKYDLSFFIDNIPLADGDFDKSPEVIATGSFKVSDYISFNASFLYDNKKTDRFNLDQLLKINDYLNIGAGFISSPDVYYVTAEIVYNRLNLSYTFFDIGGLPNCLMFELSLR